MYEILLSIFVLVLLLLVCLFRKPISITIHHEYPIPPVPESIPSPEEQKPNEKPKEGAKPTVTQAIQELMEVFDNGDES